MPDERHDLGGELVQVAYGNDPLEAKMIQGLLESGGVPAVVGRRGMDGPMYGYVARSLDASRRVSATGS